VQKELAIAMTNEINNGNVKVLPVLIENCQLPAALSDKLYANCEGFRYYSGLRDLIETIEPRDRYDQVAAKYHDLSDPMESALALERALSSDDLNAVRDFLRTRPHLLVCLFGRMWDLSEAIDDFKLCEPHHFVDYLIANGQSYGFEFHVVHLGPLSWLKEYSEEVRRYADGLENFIREARKNYSEFSRAATIRFSDEQISPRFAWQEDDRQHEIRGTLLVGRRREHEDDHNFLRNAIYLRTHGLVEVASYDRLLNAVKKFDNSRSRPEVPGVWERPRTLGPMRHKDD
jgi:hypothetical protein